MADHQAAAGNAAQIEFWNSAATRAWADQYARMDGAVAGLTKELLDLAAPQPGERVLDIGCGPGTTVLELARHVGLDGHVLGADVSEPSVARARERIAAAGLRHAEVIVADASVHPFAPDSFEVVFSRFGIMFFSDPMAAFANVRRAMKPGGRLALAVFRAASKTLWPNAPLEAVRHLLPPIPTPEPEEPGPFSVSLALPGASGEKIDWLDVRLAEGPAVVRTGILAAAVVVPSPEDIAEFERRQAQRDELEDIKSAYPLPKGLAARLEYRARESGEIWIHKFIKGEEDEETGERNETWLPVCSPMSPALRLHMLDDDDLYGLRVCLVDMEDHPRAVDFYRGELARLAASEIRSRLLGAGLRVANGGESTIVEILKEARPERYLDMASATGWKHDQFVSPGGDRIGTGGDLELAADVRLAAEIARGGTLMGWQAATEAAAKVKNCPHWMLGVAGGFVGPILQLCELETCGIDLSGPTSCGKTLGQQLGISVWTSPRLSSGGLLKPARFTQNSIELLARRVCQQALLNRLEPIFEPIFDDANFGYRRGRSTKDALRKVMLPIAPFCATNAEICMRGSQGYWKNDSPTRLQRSLRSWRSTMGRRASWIWRSTTGVRPASGLSGARLRWKRFSI